jgi:hypothetical protein
MAFEEIGWDDVDWIHMAEDRNQWWSHSREHWGEPSGFIKAATFSD